ncbi:hypothetical protein [Haloferax sp. Atlit-19N]|uniref:hypothetical protein n=1 Tax=Haloferax sp. Atlit-19N TaxID=2077201 RepID=UPI0011C01CA4|nr:hypothetical protein [Haloferax sp. Atlit-19N]
MIEKRIDEIFEVDEANEVVYLSDDIPEELQAALHEARQDVKQGSEFSVVDIGKYQRPLEYGAGKIRVLPTESASIFAREEDDGRIKMLSVGVSSSGRLSEFQVKQVLREMGRSAKLTPEEMSESRQFTLAIRSINQSKLFVNRNSQRLMRSVAKLQQELSELDEQDGSLNEIITTVEINLHNLLSSVYTFHETVKSSLKRLDIARGYTHYVQKYHDSVSTAIGLRHCIQHNFTLKVQWVGTYSHEYDMYDFNIIIPIAEVKDPDLYTSKRYADASGEKHQPIDYFYSDISGRNIDIEDLTVTIRRATENTYDSLLSELEDDERVKNTNLEQLGEVSKFHIEAWLQSESE